MKIRTSVTSTMFYAAGIILVSLTVGSYYNSVHLGFFIVGVSLILGAIYETLSI